MIVPNLTILYVDNPLSSARFYEALLGRPPSTLYPTYAAFDLGDGRHLGLWSTTARDFVSSGTGHRSELAFMVAGDQDVDALHTAWTRLGVPVEQAPMDAVFGRTFVALDPDGHRLRVCTPDD
ncbi:VOC family protein [Paludibacterium paludis]|uniref:Glyoxalase n=1 Tax=Paludibacterium paludis TaxID=1225769 RepID=A0A918U7J7_9NEIS|nr:VOC family protein [Paludibacterium paludis]GGY05985.1 glyoxalase [Paludibacterium paludis]